MNKKNWKNADTVKTHFVDPFILQMYANQMDISLNPTLPEGTKKAVKWDSKSANKRREVFPYVCRFLPLFSSQGIKMLENRRQTLRFIAVHGGDIWMQLKF